MKKWILILILIFALLFCCALCFIGFWAISQSSDLTSSTSEIKLDYYSGDRTAKDKILLVKINGTILDTRDDVSGLLSEGYVFGYEIKNIFYQAANDDNIKGVLVVVNSGGGTVLGSRAIVDGINHYKNTTHKPVYGYIQGFAASGAYMAVSACDYITADYGSMTGSIGVIFGTPFQYYNKVMTEGYSSGEYIATQNGIETFYVSAGEYKDLGSPYRKMTDEELSSLQNSIKGEYDEFVNLVSANRSISQTKIKEQIKALIYGNEQAKVLGLIDSQATYEDTLNLLKTKAGITNYQIVTNSQKSLLSLLLESYIKKDQVKSSSKLQNRVLLIYGDPTMYE